MENVYNQVEFPFTINVPPSKLHKGLYSELEKMVKERLEGTCHPRHGYVKKGSVQIIKKQIGKSEGAHFTGNMTFHLQVRCSVAHPVIGQTLPCLVIGKNDIGILTTNYQLPAYTMLIVRMPTDVSGALDRVQKGSYIEVTVIDYQLKAANEAERTKPEYWLICKLASAKTVESRYRVLPPVSDKPMIMLVMSGLDRINDMRDELTSHTYTSLEDTKRAIQSIRTNYIDMIKDRNGRLINDDIFLKALRNKAGAFVVGEITNVEVLGNRKYMHTVKVIGSSNLKFDDVVKIRVTDYYSSPSIGSTVLYQGYVSGTATSHTILDIWDRHIKYVINETEMVHAPKAYILQISTLIKTTEKGVKTQKDGRKMLFIKEDKPIAAIIYKDPNVISRAYYKMAEMITFFGDTVFLNRGMKIASIAESPGGFIQALLDQRVYNPYGDKELLSTIKDDITAISIGIDEGAWLVLADKVKDYKYVNLRTGDTPIDPSKTNLLLIGGIKDRADRSGDILNPDVRARYYLEFAEEGADLVTGDGGTSRDKTTTSEEMDTHRLLLAEIVMALNCQKVGGCFILKIYDMATEFTVNLLEVLSYCYEEIGLFKPGTSRAASSEKYLICKNLQVGDKAKAELLGSLEQVLAVEPDADKYYGNMLGVANKKLKEAVTSYNNFYMKKQIGFIETGRNYAVMYNNAIKSNSADKMIYDILAKVGNQVSVADDFQHTNF